MENLKNCIKYLMLTMLTLCPLVAQSFVNPGDVNNDKQYDVSDVSALINVILGKGSAVSVPKACDVNKDGYVDVGDVDRLIQFVLKGRKTYPDIVVPEGSVAYTVGDVTFYMVPVEGGTFTMPGGEHGSTHQVTLSDYSIGLTKVTCGLWKAVMGSYPYQTFADDQPVCSLSWQECQHFLDNLNHMTGLQFHLPTDAQWEFAAMGGNLSHGYLYSGSDVVTDVAWTQDEMKDAYFLMINTGWNDYTVLEVGMKMPNELGLYDMSCLLGEWIWDTDWLHYTDEPEVDPLHGGVLGEDDALGYVRDGLPIVHRLHKKTEENPFYGMRLAL